MSNETQIETPLEIAAKLREAVGLTKSYASLLANGQKTPSLKLAVQIEEKTGIAPSFWINRASAAPGTGISA